MSYRPAETHHSYGQLVIVAERLYDAVMSRDVEAVRALLDVGLAASLPREVREEALAVAALPVSSHRTPMALLRFHHRLAQLANSEDPEFSASQMEFPFRP